MNKGVQATLGIVLFVLLLMPVLGSIVGYSEATAFNTAKVETIQRIKETGVGSDSVNTYVESVNERFDDTFKVEVANVDGGDGSYGDVIRVKLSAEGSGAFQFNKSKKQVEEEGLAEGDNLPKYETVEEIIIDRRAE